jgi:hypothetical protein
MRATFLKNLFGTSASIEGIGLCRKVVISVRTGLVQDVQRLLAEIPATDEYKALAPTASLRVAVVIGSTWGTHHQPPTKSRECAATRARIHEGLRPSRTQDRARVGGDFSDSAGLRFDSEKRDLQVARHDLLA